MNFLAPRSIAAWSVGAMVLVLSACADDATPDAIVATPDGGGGDSDGGTCASGTWDNGGTCVEWTTCKSGTYVTSPPSATKDRTCSACESGTFSSTSNVARCTPWRSCEAATFVETAGSATADQVCKACAAGTFSSKPNQASCVPQGQCAAGTAQTTAGTSSAAPVCTDCVAGTHCAGGVAPSAPCAAGTWDHDENPASACVPWTECIAGQSVATAGTNLANRTCSPCAGGTFTAAANVATCAAWTNCVPGEKVKTAGTTSANRSCEACPAGMESETQNAAECAAIQTTPAPGALATGLGLSGGHSCAVVEGGFAKCWGTNHWGTIGDGTAGKVDGADGLRLTPALVAGLTKVTALVGGNGHTCALQSTGKVSCWGSNYGGQLGTDSIVDSFVPVEVMGIAGATAISSGGNHMCAVDAGVVKCWGRSWSGLGIGGDTGAPDTLKPTPAVGLPAPATVLGGGPLANHTCAAAGATADAYCWGSNFDGQVGDGTSGNDNGNRYAPVKVPNVSGVTQFALGANHTCALAGTDVKCWGGNAKGQLGNGSALPATIAVTVQTGAKRLVAGRETTCAQLNDDSVKCWGANTSGMFGDNTITNRLQPTTIANLAGVKQLASGNIHMCGLFGQSVLKCWGGNSSGQLGDSTQLERREPTNVSW